MQMRVLTTLTVLRIVTTALVTTACGDDIKRGNAGESCTAANDCANGLACIALVCVASSSNTQSDAGKADSASCGARSDCAEGFMCVSNTCKSITTGVSAGSRQGGRGESCTAANDCKADLSCLTGMCRESGISLEHLPKACYRVECETKDDCCATFTPNPNCDMYKKNCETDPIFCNTYRSLCECSKSCQMELCVAAQPGCKSDQECTSAQTPFCVDGTCHQCNQDSACPGEMSKCASGVCMSPCSDDSNCPLLYACQDNACVQTGCMGDRECAFVTKNPRAVCKDKKCQSPCASDGDCSTMDPTNASFQACEAGQCKFVGCASDTECRAALNIASVQGKIKAVCR
jgi:hypothetical protein